eukprot:101358_1
MDCRATRFSRSKDGRMWSEVVHDEPDGAIELTYPPSLERIVDKCNRGTIAIEDHEVIDVLKRDKSELVSNHVFGALHNIGESRHANTGPAIGIRSICIER